MDVTMCGIPLDDLKRVVSAISGGFNAPPAAIGKKCPRPPRATDDDDDDDEVLSDGLYVC